MTLSIQNILAEIDPDQVLIQPLDACLEGANRLQRGTKYTFVSDQPFTLNLSTMGIQTERQGLVLWLDRKEVKNILENDKGRPSCVPEKHENHLRLLRTSLQYLVEKGFGSISLSNDDLVDMLNKVDDLFTS